MAGHAAAHGENALSGLHAGDVLGACLQTHQNHLFAAVVPGLGILGREHHLAAGSARRSAQTLADGRGGLQRLGVELRVQQRIQIARVDHRHGFLLGFHAFLYKIDGDLQRGGRGALAAAALQHIELFIFDGKLHILHVVVVILQRVAHLDKFRIRLGEFGLHLRNGHRGAHAGHNVLALRVLQELAHQLLLAGGRIARKGNACAGFVVQVAEHHRHHVHGRAPGIGDVVVAAVNVRTGVIPGTEHGFDGQLQLLDGLGREILAQLLLIFALELLGQVL